MTSVSGPIAPARSLCILHSEDAVLRDRLAHSLQDRAYVCHAPDQNRLDELLEGPEPLLLIVDLRTPDALSIVQHLHRLHPHVVALALGMPESDPFIGAKSAGIYRVEALETEPRLLRAIIDAALERVGWMQENQMLREELARLRLLQQHGGGGGGRGVAERTSIKLQPLVKATRQLDPLEELFEKIVEGVASSAMVSRVGLFYRYAGEANYRLQAQRCCLDDTAALEFSDRDPLVRWLQRHPRLITRASLEHIADPTERSLLRRSLDVLGAETFIPLNLRGRVLGWLFTGQSDGLPFDYNDHPELSLLSEHVVQSMENTIRHHEVLRQKDLGENLLQMMPTAVITVDPEGNVRWCNAPAEKLFPALKHNVVPTSGKPIPLIPAEDLGSRVAGLLRDALSGEPTREPRVWESQSAGGRILSARTRQLLSNGACLGAVALIDDITEKLFLDAQQEQQERAVFWRDLAAGLSHEIRNPLVAIKTFTQLLPKRHADAEFRQDFAGAMAREVGRLETIVSQIEGFAHPPVTSDVGSIDMPALLEKAAAAARKSTGAEEAKITISADDDLPTVYGDPGSLGQSFQHLFTNAIEAAARKRTRAVIRVRIVPQRAGEQVAGVKLSILDNGDGIPPELQPKVFSPFCTIKAQGMGLGLAIAQRVVLDHGGRIEVDATGAGVCVNVSLPLRPPAGGSSGMPAGGSPATQLPPANGAALRQAAEIELGLRARSRSELAK